MFLCSYIFLRGGNSNIFGIFTPKIGEMIQFDEHIFQMGWNHQLDLYCNSGNCMYIYLVKFLATSHPLGPQKVAFWKGNGTLYFREIQAGEIV